MDINISDDKYQEIEQRQRQILYNAITEQHPDCQEWFEEIWDTSKGVQRKILLEYMKDKQKTKTSQYLKEVVKAVKKAWKK